jgi:hypothetical protein
MNRRQPMLPWAGVLLFLLVSISQAASRDELLVDALVNNLTHSGQQIRVEALRALGELGDPAAIPALIELLRLETLFHLSPVPTLERLAGEKVGEDWPAWVEWLQKHKEIRPNPGFLTWKSYVFGRIDPAFNNFLYPGVPYRVRIEEIVWGGVRKDGIPALTNPKHVKPEEATYLTPQELVFGLSINGDHRAYPLRILDWHEMFNDVVGGKPLTLSY